MHDDRLDDLGHLDTATRSAVDAMGGPGLDSRVPGLTIAAHPAPERIGERAALLVLASGGEAQLSRLEPNFAQPSGGPRRPLADPHLSRRALSLRATADGGVDLGNRPGLLVEADGEPVGESRRFSAVELARGVMLVLARRVSLILRPVDLVAGSGPTYGLVGDSAEIGELRRAISRVADLEVPVLLRGETGTGKELVARGLHRGSGRRNRPFVAVNMGAVPPTLAAAELFGSVKGAFTGADHARQGHFSQAHGGTLFLDEIGETPPEVQPMLLRALETGEVQAVGSESPRHLDVRILAATDADLEAAIESGRFRAPLLHRLAGFEIHLPPLRDRYDDIPRLLLYFLRQELEAIGGSEISRLRNARRPWLPAPLVARFAAHDWPGNVRQLRNAARQLVISNRGKDQLELPSELEALLASAPRRPPPAEPSRRSDQPPPGATETAGTEPPREVVRTLLALRWHPRETRAGVGAGLFPVRSRHERTLRMLLAEYEGREVERGDGFLMLFERPAEAVGFALEAQEELGRGTEERGSGPADEPGLAAGIGIFLGEILCRSNSPEAVARGARPIEVEGLTAARARQLAERALPGQVLLEHGAHALARRSAVAGHPLGEAEVRWVEHGEIALDDRGARVDVYEVGLEDAAPFRSPAEAGGEIARDRSPERPAYRAPKDVSEGDLVRALRQHAFRIKPTAEALGISRTSLYALIDASPRIRKAQDLSREEIEGSRAEYEGDLDRMAEALEVSRKGLSRRMTMLGM
ncbi:MAG: sigma 54-interacting transcriptional regulator [Holophagales bacterium]|nr:sigma 54-interacting transcriptional regulator [Holophagales bacterium]